MWHNPITFTIYYNLHLGYKMYQVMGVKNDNLVMISKLRLACNLHCVATILHILRFVDHIFSYGNLFRLYFLF